MAWETRKYGRYYYETRREGDKVRRIYHGRGAKAERAAAEVQARKQQRQAAQQAKRDLMAQVQTWLQPLNMFCQHVDALADGLMLAAGFCKRQGRWKRNTHA